MEGYLHKVNPETGDIVGLENTRLKAVTQIEAYANKLFAQDVAGSVYVFEIK